MTNETVMQQLAREYALFYLNPDVDTQEEYREVVLRGHDVETKSLEHYIGSDSDTIDMTDTPVGQVRVVTLGNRHDFELAIRGLSAAKHGPHIEVPKSQGAAMHQIFNWPRIHTYLAGFPKEQRHAEFKKFTSVKENYIDMLIILSRGPYSNISAERIGLDEKTWLDHSNTIRKYHELTHVICRKQYPDNIDIVRDELVADAIGLFATYGSFDPEKVKLFLGIDGETYIEGRLANYTDDPQGQTPEICKTLSDMKIRIDAENPSDPFDLIPVLMKNA